MTEMTPNDSAFIKVSIELMKRRNDLLALQKLKAATGRFDNWTRNQLGGIRSDTLHSDEYQGMGKILSLIAGDRIEDAIETTNAKLEELTRLSETYIRGGDIVAAKLAKP